MSRVPAVVSWLIGDVRCIWCWYIYFATSLLVLLQKGHDLFRFQDGGDDNVGGSRVGISHLPSRELNRLTSQLINLSSQSEQSIPCES